MLSHKEIWKIDTTTGILIWRVNNTNLLDYKKHFMNDFGHNKFALLTENGLQIRSKVDGTLLETLINPDPGYEWHDYCVDNDFNIYFSAKNAYSKYDSSLNQKWLIPVTNTNFKYIYYNTVTNLILLVKNIQSHIYSVNPETGAIVRDSDLGLNYGEYSIADWYMDGPIMYFVLGDDEDDKLLLCMYFAETGVVIVNHDVSTLCPECMGEYLDVENGKVYVSAMEYNNATDERWAAYARFNAITGNLELIRKYFDSTPDQYLGIRQMEVLGHKAFIPLYRNGFDTVGIPLSGLFVIDNISGDSLHYYTFPGRMQFPTAMESIFQVAKDTLLSISHLGHILDVSMYNQDLEPIFTLYIPWSGVMDFDITSNRIAVITQDMGPATTPDHLNLFSGRHFYLYNFKGEQLFHTELEINETYHLAIHQDQVHIIQDNIHDRFWIVENDAILKEIIPEQSVLTGKWESGFVNWNTTGSVFMNLYYKNGVSGIVLNQYTASSQIIAPFDTILNYSATFASAIQDDDLYLSTSTSTNTRTLYKYNLLSHQKFGRKLI
jgi:hypothetical protein